MDILLERPAPTFVVVPRQPMLPVPDQTHQPAPAPVLAPERAPDPPVRAWPARLARILVRERVLLAGLLLAAVAVRLPYLWQIPRFTDELQEILWALAIYRGEIRPLTAVDSYYGPLWSYLMAGVFSLDVRGASLELLPRLLALLLAVVTVAVTYGVARDMAGRPAALVAAALLVTSGGHVIINSHTARSNSVTPLLTTLLVWALFRAARDGNGRLLMLAGLLFALALQTHVSAIAFVPGLALGVLLARPRLLVSRWTMGAVLALLVGYANMIAYNLLTGFWSLVHARALQQGYTGGRSLDLATYLTNLGALVESLSRLVSGTIDEAGNPVAVPYLLAASVGLLLLARRGVVLPLLFCLSAALVLPIFNPRYGPILSGRYIVPLLPFLYLGLGVLLEEAGRRLVARGEAGRRLVGPEVAWRPLAVRLAAAALVLFPLAPLALYYDEVLDDRRTNAPLFALSRAVTAAYQRGDLVLVDEALAQEPLTAGGTDLKAIRMLLEADGIPYQVAKLTTSELATIVPEHPGVLVVMDAKKESQLGRRLHVAPLTPELESASGSGREYAVYRLARKDTAHAPGAAMDALESDTQHREKEGRDRE